MIKTYNQLYKYVEENENIDDDALSILHELDETGSVVTQASLNEILLILFRRLDKAKIRISGLSEHVTKEQFKAWVEEKFDEYTVKLFKNSIE